MLLPLASCASSTGFEAVSISSDTANIRLSVLGTYRGGMYSTKTPAAPPGYDRRTRRLFLGSDDREAIDVLDISDPRAPRRLFGIDLGPFGVAPDALAVAGGIVAVTVKDPTDSQSPRQLLLFNVDGKPLADPIALWGARRLAFTATGDRLVVGLAGVPGRRDAGVAVIDLGRIDHTACRRGGPGCGIQPRIRTVDFTALNGRRAEIAEAGVRILSRQGTVAQDLRPGTIAIAPASQIAWVNLQKNNAIAVIDLDTAALLDVQALPYKDHGLPGQGLDASDRDGVIAIRPWPIRVLYQPDGLAVIEIDGEAFLISANEGDPHESQGTDEYARVLELTLDREQFPEADILQREENIGRLRVSRLTGDIDGDGDHDALYVLGARSFAVWTAELRLLYDSGDQFERIVARALPAYFNVSESANDFDARSDDRGPEPEVVAVGEVASRRYAFIGLERIGGVMVYDITDPRGPRFEQYINNRNFAVDPAEVCGEKGRMQSSTCITAGDLEPEGLLFIAAEDSPVHAPRLVVLHELSDSATLYRIDPAIR